MSNATPETHLSPIAYSIEEACQVTSISRSGIYNLVRDGKIRLRKIGRRSVILASELHQLVCGEA